MIDMITETITIILLLIGASLVLLAGVGIVRMPDLFTRMHVSTKSATLGVGTIVLALAIHFGELGVTTRGLLVIFFLLLTAPVGAHLIGRAGYLSGVELWEGTRWDELKGKYHAEERALDSPTSMQTRESDIQSSDPPEAIPPKPQAE